MFFHEIHENFPQSFRFYLHYDVFMLYVYIHEANNFSVQLMTCALSMVQVSLCNCLLGYLARSIQFIVSIFLSAKVVSKELFNLNCLIVVILLMSKLT